MLLTSGIRSATNLNTLAFLQFSHLFAAFAVAFMFLNESKIKLEMYAKNGNTYDLLIRLENSMPNKLCVRACVVGR